LLWVLPFRHSVSIDCFTKGFSLVIMLAISDSVKKWRPDATESTETQKKAMLELGKLTLETHDFSSQHIVGSSWHFPRACDVGGDII
jgi:hypothetical protein